jgi:uncharacterized protein
LTHLFEGKRSDLELFLKKSVNDKFYVYLLCRPDRTPFYVGKGIDRRVFHHEMEAHQAHPVGETNPFKCNVIRKIEQSGQKIVYQIDRIYGRNDEQTCLDREAALIMEIGRFHEGGPLTNLAGGVGNTSGSSPYSTQKHADTLSGEPENNPERAKLNRFLQGIGPVKSVPVKPINQISRILPTKPHSQPRKPTQRCAFALIASACAHGLQILPDVEIPRSFMFEGVEGVIENGVARDILKADMADLISVEPPQKERFRMDTRQCEVVINLAGETNLIKRGLL